MQDISSMTVLHASVGKHKSDPFKNRIAIIDFLRGVLIVLVIFDHLMYDFYAFLPDYFQQLGITSGGFYDFVQDFFLSRDPEICYFDMPIRRAIRDIALSMFVLLSGVSSAFSKDNNKRAVRMALFAVVLSLVTNLFQGYMHHWDITFNATAINFNIIALIATCVLVYCLVENKSPTFLVILTICFMAFYAFLLPIIEEDMAKEPFLFFPFFKPNSIRVNNINYFMVDYMPLFPYIIWFFVGATFAKVVYEHPSQHLSHNYNWMRPMCFCGRHSLSIYVFHQIILYLIFIAISEIIRAVV